MPVLMPAFPKGHLSLNHFTGLDIKSMFVHFSVDPLPPFTQSKGQIV